MILGLALLFGALSLEKQDPPDRPSQANGDATPLTLVQKRVRIELNEAVQSYREGNLAEARRHAETAQEYDPLNKNARLFLARIIHRQYKSGDRSPDNITKADDAINAYRRILVHDPQNEEAYKAIASLFGAIEEDGLQRQWILQRAVDATFSPEQRAEAYTVIASKDWHCANEITDLPTNKTVQVVGNRATVIFKRPGVEAEFQKAKLCLTSGMEKIEKAIALTPESEAAWSYKVNLLLEGSKLAEMEGQADRKADFEQQARKARRHTEELSAKQKQQNPSDNKLTVRPEPSPKTKKQEEPNP